METNKMKLPFFFLTILAIASFAQMVEAEDCSVLLTPCSGSCWRSGHCQSCCRKYGYPEGKCSLKHGDGCYCCGSPCAGAVGPQAFLP